MEQQLRRFATSSIKQSHQVSRDFYRTCCIPLSPLSLSPFYNTFILQQILEFAPASSISSARSSISVSSICTQTQTHTARAHASAVTRPFGDLASSRAKRQPANASVPRLVYMLTCADVSAHARVRACAARQQAAAHTRKPEINKTQNPNPKPQTPSLASTCDASSGNSARRAEPKSRGEGRRKNVVMLHERSLPRSCRAQRARGAYGVSGGVR